MPDPTSVVYEIHLRTFTAEGTFAAAIAHLEHLATLGVTMIELVDDGHDARALEGFAVACRARNITIDSNPGAAESEFPQTLHAHLAGHALASDALARLLMGAPSHVTSTRTIRASHRLVHQAGTEGARIAAALLLTSRFVPMLVQGEEWGASARLDSVLDWSEITHHAHSPLLWWHRALLALRRETPELSDPDPATLHAEQRGALLVVERGPFTLFVNASDRSIAVALDRVVLRSRLQNRPNELPPRSCALVRQSSRVHVST